MGVLLIPGLLSDRFVWGPLLGRIAADVADLTTQTDITQMAQDCLDSHPGPLRVAGHSMGARVAMEMACLAPDRVTRLALLDTGVHPLAEGELDRRREIVAFAEARGMRALADRWLPGMVADGNRTDAALMSGLTDMVLRMSPQIHARQIEALINRPDARTHLEAIACPVLLMVGKEDRWSPVSQHRDMARLLPLARLEIIPKAGHFAPVENPGPVAALLDGFLTADG